MTGCNTMMQGYPRLDDACHRGLPHTGTSLSFFVALAIALIAVGALMFIAARARR